MVGRWVRRAGIFVAIVITLLIGFVLFLHTAVGKSAVRKKLQGFLQPSNEHGFTDSLVYRPRRIAGAAARARGEIAQAAIDAAGKHDTVRFNMILK